MNERAWTRCPLHRPQPSATHQTGHDRSTLVAPATPPRLDPRPISIPGFQDFRGSRERFRVEPGLLKVRFNCRTIIRSGCMRS
ncbi:hypothetical protein RSAG8_01162, partial [Rhizoctonia solani AG-8 WAC10335]